MYKFFVPQQQETSGGLERLEVDGKFFRAAGKRVFLKAVTYGPFPDPQPDHGQEMKRIAAAGFNAVRIYGSPDPAMLDAAHAHGLWVLVGLTWQWGSDFLRKSSLFAEALVDLRQGLAEWGAHPAVAIVMVANEVPADMVRWMGVLRVRQAIERLIDLGRRQRPRLLFAYANYPTTEYLEPDNADFTAMNVYLERREDFADYLPRLHNVAGDRPVLISEFGLDSLRGSEQKQREVLLWQLDECLASGMAGTTVYAWSDRWLNGKRIMDDWAFGLTDVSGREKPAYEVLSKRLPAVLTPEDGVALESVPSFSVVVCTHNGGHRMHACLSAICAIDYPDYEVIVVNDGSSDDTEEVVGRFEGVRLINVEHIGLSAARNRGAEEASGEIIAYTDDDCEPDAAWLTWLARAFVRSQWDACGGPNLPPVPPHADYWEHVDEAVVAAAPGAPTHVLFDDGEAEHLPGCNLVVRKRALQAIGGFHADYRVAGDDVDFCWRLRAAGFRMGFSGAAFVWHRRRTTLWRYFKQQYGYGKAEALLMRDHPEKFRRSGGARWMGRVYAGGAMCADPGSVIYHGAMGLAAYQQVSLTVQPQRALPSGFDGPMARFKLAVARVLQPRIRGFARWRHSLRWRWNVERVSERKPWVTLKDAHYGEEEESIWWGETGIYREDVLVALQQAGWDVWHRSGTSAAHEDWDLVRGECRVLVAREHHEGMSLLLVRQEFPAGRGQRIPRRMLEVMHSLGLQQV
ncbi:glycosyltransferase [Verrucomicrobiaceae bacterium N1E253]|uniref:Glycosyltransferase n=1 Tax=Oceaniferula marina TaxID=2748318 RepID=A0A851GJV2_9BACT|nr:glycosyltransferase [Oceaniferula marina]NWK55445.1 glycosyltransferase [Oceaniferula marina]